VAKSPRKTKKPEQLWAALAAAEGIDPKMIDAHTAKELTKSSRKPRRPRKREFRHPDREDMPSVDTMLSALRDFDSDERVHRGCLGANIFTSREIALRAETLIYNAWVELECRKRRLVTPGRLLEDDFHERYWSSPREGNDE
jgi:hypothetical protein